MEAFTENELAGLKLLLGWYLKRDPRQPDGDQLRALKSLARRWGLPELKTKK